METTSNKSLTFKHISIATDDIVSYINNRRLGVSRSLKTKWKKFNDSCNGGLEPNVVITACGISGAGKSAFVNSLETDLFDLNPDIDFVVLSFSLEMLSSKVVGRKLSYKLKKTTSELYTAEKTLSDYDFNRVIQESKQIRNYPVYYVDTPGSVTEISNTINVFRELISKEKWLVIILDHTLLLKPNPGQGERETIVELQRLFIEQKKIGLTTIIQLSQLNREIEATERINNPLLHFPQRRDLSSSDSVYQGSDYVIVLHRPEILGLKTYGSNHWPVANMIYMHLLKVRDGEPKILSFVNNLKYNSIDEYIPISNQ
jgi:replicative DNA helicase